MTLVLLLAGLALASAGAWPAGIRLSNATDVLTMRLGRGEAVGGVTVLTAATALPEVSAGPQSLKLRDYQLAVSDIFGGDACGLLFRPRRQRARFEPDSLAVIVLYALGIVGLAFVTQ